MDTPADTSLQNQPLLPPPPALVMDQQSYTAHGSVGPAIAVVAVIAVLGVVAGMIGRICAGRSFMGYGHFDVEAWMDSKFSSCIDGHVDALPPRRYRPPPPDEMPAPDAEVGRSESAQPPGSSEVAPAEHPAEVNEEGEEDDNNNLNAES
ncbi:hypothetical protein V2J09_002119 [Rumex salicifolius]